MADLVEKFWEKFPQLFDPIQDFFNGNYYEVLMEELKDYPRSTVLDLGCGVGSLLKIINPKEYVGVDINASFINWAKKIYRDRPKTEFVCADALQYLPRKKFDMVIASSFTHHLSDQQLKKLLEHLNERVDFRYLVINDGKPSKTVWKPVLLWLDIGANFRDIQVITSFFKKDYRVVKKGMLSANRPFYYYPFVVAKKKKRS